MVLLGVVSNVEDLELRVSLPGRLVGVVPLTNVSPAYTAALEVYVYSCKKDTIVRYILTTDLHLGKRRDH